MEREVIWLIKTNDKVRVVKQKQTKNYENTCGKEGFVVYIDYMSNKYGVEFPDIKNPASHYGRYYFEEGELELVENKIPTLDKIVAERLTCVIHTPNREDAISILAKIPSSSPQITSNEWLAYWNSYRGNTCYYIIDGAIDGYCEKEWFESHNDNDGNPYTIYEFSDLFAIGGVVSIHDLPTSEWYNPMRLSFKNGSFIEAIPQKVDAVRGENHFYNVDELIKKEFNVKWIEEEKKMSTNFKLTITEGARERKSHEKGKPKKIGTISTTVRTELGQATTTCDKSNYYDIYTGALVAAAKITAHKSEEAMLLFKTAIDMWGNEMCTSILKALANRAFINDKFDWAYKRWRKAVAYEERQNDIKARTCAVCGKVFDTVEDARAHEKWHDDCRTYKIERREAKRRLAEAEREGRISDIMTELLEERKKNDETLD